MNGGQMNWQRIALVALIFMFAQQARTQELGKTAVRERALSDLREAVSDMNSHLDKVLEEELNIDDLEATLSLLQEKGVNPKQVRFGSVMPVRGTIHYFGNSVKFLPGGLIKIGSNLIRDDVSKTGFELWQMIFNKILSLPVRKSQQSKSKLYSPEGILRIIGSIDSAVAADVCKEIKEHIRRWPLTNFNREITERECACFEASALETQNCELGIKFNGIARDMPSDQERLRLYKDLEELYEKNDSHNCFSLNKYMPWVQKLANEHPQEFRKLKKHNEKDNWDCFNWLREPQAKSIGSGEEEQSARAPTAAVAATRSIRHIRRHKKKPKQPHERPRKARTAS
jgi:hypothetical protein